MVTHWAHNPETRFESDARTKKLKRRIMSYKIEISELDTLIIFKFYYHRLVVRTSGFHPENTVSITVDSTCNLNIVKCARVE